MTGGKRSRAWLVAFGALILAAFLHVLAYHPVGSFAPSGVDPGKTTLILVTGCVLLSSSLTLSQAMEMVTRAFYARSDLDLLLASPHCVERGFVDEVGEVSTAHPRRAPGHHGEVDVVVEALVLAVHLEDRHPLLDLGQGDDDLAVEPTGTQKGGVEDVGPIGGRHHHDALSGLEAVHLRQQLVERLLALVVAAAEAGTALATN